MRETYEPNVIFVKVQMSYLDSIDNGVNESRFTNEGLSLMATQHRTGHHHATAVRTQRKWTLIDSRIVMECLYKSDPGIFGYGGRITLIIVPYICNQ